MYCRLLVVILVNIFTLNLLEIFLFFFILDTNLSAGFFFLILKWVGIDLHSQLILFFPPVQRFELSKCCVLQFYFFGTLL